LRAAADRGADALFVQPIADADNHPIGIQGSRRDQFSAATLYCQMRMIVNVEDKPM
jgi:hypothetical protein